MGFFCSNGYEQERTKMYMVSPKACFGSICRFLFALTTPLIRGAHLCVWFLRLCLRRRRHFYDWMKPLGWFYGCGLRSISFRPLYCKLTAKVFKNFLYKQFTLVSSDPKIGGLQLDVFDVLFVCFYTQAFNSI